MGLEITCQNFTMRYGVTCVVALLVLFQTVKGQSLEDGPLKIIPGNITLRVVKTISVGTPLTTLSVANTGGMPVSFFIMDYKTDQMVKLESVSNKRGMGLVLKSTLEAIRTPTTRRLYVVASTGEKKSTATITMEIVSPVSPILTGLNSTGLIANPPDVETVVSNIALFTKSLCDSFSRQSPATSSLAQFRLFCLIFEAVYLNLPPGIFPDDPVGINQPPTFFGPQVSFTVREDAPIGFAIGLLTATDSDGPREITFSPMDSFTARVISLGAPQGRSSAGRTATLYLRETLDREEASLITLYVTATDSKSTATVMVTLDVIDVNDNTPVFSRKTYQFTIRSSAKPGDKVGEVLATDSDVSTKRISYSFLGLDPQTEGLFSINNVDGSIYLKQSMRNRVNQTVTVAVSAKDEDGLFSSAAVRFFITNRNVSNGCVSNPCRNGGSCVSRTDGSYTCYCLSGYLGSLCEYSDVTIDGCARNPCQNGATCISGIKGNFTCLCRRGDTGIYCQYSNTKGSCFTRPCQNGGICVRTNGTYRCSCTTGFKGNYCQIRDVPIDGCASSPCQNGATCISGIKGNFSCLCRRGDTGLYCQYRNVSNGCVSNPCQNGGSCVSQTDGSYTCFCLIGYQGSLCEYRDVTIDSCASNPCQNSGRCISDISGKFSCLCQRGFTGLYCQNRNSSRPCSINPCVNGGSCSQRGDGSSTCLCPTSFTGANCETDITLRFRTSVTVMNVSESSPIGTAIGNVYVEDLYNTNDPIFLSSNDTRGLLRFREAFSQSSASWTVYLQASLDREQQSTWAYLLSVTRGNRRANATLIINVTDINDNSPVFSSAVYFANIDGDAVQGTPVTTVYAVDSDIGENGAVYYNITDGQQRSKFTIGNRNGVITVNDSLLTLVGQQLSLTVTAKDGTFLPRFTTATVLIRVRQGDGKIKFATTFTTVNVSESAQKGTLLARIPIGPVFSGRLVSLTSNDTKGIISLRLIRTTSTAVAFVYLNSVRARETNATWAFNVTASDGINTVNTTLILKFTNTNNYAPVITYAPSTVNLDRRTRVGTQIGTVYARDPDTGRNGLLTFAITNGSTGYNFFNISNQTGVIILNRSLAFLPVHSVSVVVRVKDGGSPSLQNFTTIRVILKPESQCVNNPCQNGGNCSNFNGTAVCACPSRYSGPFCERDSFLSFRQTKMVFSVAESTLPGVTLGFLHVEDLFQEPSLSPIYLTTNDTRRILRFEEMASSVTKSWRVILNSALDREMQSMWVISVVANLAARRATAAITLNVTDINDNAPVFERVYSLTVDNTLLPGYPVTTVYARDLDAGPNGTVTYNITGSTQGLPRFQINRNTGLIFVSTPLLPLTGRTIYLNVTAIDGGRPPLNTTTVVRISIHQGTSCANNPCLNGGICRTTQNGTAVCACQSGYSGSRCERASSLRFRQSTLVVSVKESSRRGYRFGVLQVDDLLQPSTGQVYLRTNDTQRILRFRPIFTSATASWEVLLDSTLDREVKSTWTFSIMAILGNRSTNATVVLNVTDVNDNAPVFNRTYSVSVDNDAYLGFIVTTVNATDSDSGQNGTVYYNITGSTRGDPNFPTRDSTRFRINSMTGVIYVNSSLVSLARQTVYLNVTASDRGQPPRFTTTVVRIYIREGNGGLKFTSRYTTLNVSEAATRGTELFRFSLTSGGQTLRLWSNDTRGILALGMSTINGLTTVTATLNRLLDREKNMTMAFAIFVKLGTESASTLVILNITDVNDNSPVFNTSVLALSVNRLTVPGTIIGFVFANDSDAGMNGSVTYEITEGSQGYDYFKINNHTGALSINRSLSTVPTRVSLTVRAKDGGIPARFAYMTVRLTILTGTNSAPVFPTNPSVLRIYEDQSSNTILTSLTAVDIDGPREITFSISPTADSGLIYLGQPTGPSISGRSVDIYLRNPLTNIGSSNKTFLISAFDGISKGVIVLNMTILKRSGSFAFPADTYNLSISPSAAQGSSVIVMRALNTQGRKVNYSLSFFDQTVSQLFSINSTTGNITLRGSLAALSGRNITLRVRATINGFTPATANITIRIRGSTTAQNFFFSPKIYTVSPLDSLEQGGFLTQIVLVDPNSRLVGNEVRFYDPSSTVYADSFIIEREISYVTLRLRKSLVAQASNRIIVNLTASVSFTQLSANCTVVINVQRTGSSNPSSPIFSSTIYSASISANANIGQVVLSVNATDSDTGAAGEIRYMLTKGNMTFAINPTTGLITTRTSLTERANTQQFLTVVAVDGGRPARNSSVSVVISIGSLPEEPTNNPPSFARPTYFFFVQENLPLNSSVGIVSATDPEGGNTITFRFANDALRDFAFSQPAVTGTQRSVQILTTKRLDREVITRYSFSVVASDGSLEATTAVSVQVQDVNDNSPVFSQSLYTITVPGNTPARRIVLTPQATDADSGINGDISFSKQVGSDSDPSSAFAVERSSGRIITTRPLQDLVGQSVEFSITATDNGIPALSSDAQVRINIPNSAANIGPTFLGAPGTINIEENVDRGTQLFVATVLDTDGPGQIFFSAADRDSFDIIDIGFTGGNGTHTFASIHLKTVLNREADASNLKVFRITADDGQSLSTATVTLAIQDVNDNAPRFTKDVYSANVSKSAAPGSHVQVPIFASDPDQGNNGTVRYSIQNSSSPGSFRIDGVSGQISVASDLASLQRQTVSLRVEAKDMGIPIVLNASVTVFITVLPGSVVVGNNSSPAFSQTTYRIKVPENNRPGVVVGNVDITDTDGPRDVTVTIGGDRDSQGNYPLGVILTGRSSSWIAYLVTKTTLDREAGPPVRTVLVTASDGASSASVRVLLEVVDMNDNSPTFSSSNYTANIVSSAPVNTQVVEATATDADSDLFGTIKYSLTLVDNSPFSIDGRTGVITTTGSLSSWAGQIITLTVRATDGGRRSASVSVYINIV